MRTREFVMAALVFASSVSGAHITLADPKVQRTDADTLLITDFAGKPPFKRQYVNRLKHAELYAFYEQGIGLIAQPLMAVESRRAPGKTLPGSFQRISSDPVEIADFARFEETDEASVNDARRWSGAPGKGRRPR